MGKTGVLQNLTQISGAEETSYRAVSDRACRSHAKQPVVATPEVLMRYSDDYNIEMLLQDSLEILVKAKNQCFWKCIEHIENPAGFSRFCGVAWEAHV